jgi:uncharacterized protein YqeY
VTLKDQLQEDMRAAMRQRDELRVSTIRMVRAAIVNAEIAKGGPLDDAGVQAVIAQDVKRHRDSITEFTKARRPELVAKEEAELAILLSYLPKQLSQEEVAAAAHEVIAEVGAKSPADMGKVMRPLLLRLGDRADSRLVSQVVRELLK